MIFNINDKVDYVKEDIQGTVKRRGTNYVVLEDNNNNLHKAWIWDCIPIAADREVEVREYNLDVDYGFKAVSNIEEDKTPQDKTVSKKPGTHLKNITKIYQRVRKKRELITLKNKSIRKVMMKMIINQRQETKMPRLNHLNTHKNIRRCLVS